MYFKTREMLENFGFLVTRAKFALNRFGDLGCGVKKLDVHRPVA
jgi:hypothetical protein